MLDGLSGRIIALEPELLLQVGPLTLRLEVSAQTRASLPALDCEAHLFTELVIREERVELLGFARPEERAVYRLITGVSGVGKRLALAILSALSTEELALCVAAGDEKRLTEVSGVGKKTASRLLLELKGRLDVFLPPAGAGSRRAASATLRPEREEALLALTALGMSRATALRAMEAAGDAPLPVEELIRRALVAAAERS